MKTYKKRIMFIISDQHLILHGGIGTFARSFLDMANKLNYKVDYILDKDPRNKDLVNYITEHDGNILYNSKNLSYKGHADRFIFTDSVNLEKAINFRDSFLQAFRKNLYDAIIVNSNDAILPTMITGIQSHVPTIVFSHNGDLIFKKPDPVFKKASIDMYKQLMQADDIIVGTHSEFNKKQILENYKEVDVKVLPLPIADKGLLKDNLDISEKDGVLFVGRFEPRKNPETFLKAVSEAGLKMLIMTNDNGARKFKSKLEKLGYEEFDTLKNDKNQNNGKTYEIKYGIFGKEKEDFMKRAKLSFQPAVLEGYAYSTVEALCVCKTIVLEEYDWGKNFEGLAEFTNKKNMVEDLKRLHSEDYDVSEQTQKMIDFDNSIPPYWIDVFEKYSIYEKNPTKPTESKLLKELRKTEDSKDNEIKPQFRKIEDILEVILKRNLDAIAIDDVEMFYKIINVVDMIHTDGGTYIAPKEFNLTENDIEDEVDPTAAIF